MLARDAAAGARLRDLGASADGLWDAKLGSPPLPAITAELERLRAGFTGATVILAASTHPGEEALIARAFAAARPEAHTARLVVVPRHAERGPDVERQLRELGLTTARRTGGDAPAGVQALVADTLGELGLWYRLSSLAIVGGSLVEGIGGHNPLEPARLGCPFVAGPHVEHWPIYRDLIEAGATRLAPAGELAGWIAQAVAADPSLAAMAERASDFVRRRDLESEAIAPRLLALLPA
jgi:3-deoxy-D-manno-octulosonic-acid transferase